MKTRSSLTRLHVLQNRDNSPQTSTPPPEPSAAFAAKTAVSNANRHHAAQNSGNYGKPPKLRKKLHPGGVYSESHSSTCCCSVSSAYISHTHHCNLLDDFPVVDFLQSQTNRFINEQKEVLKQCPVLRRENDRALRPLMRQRPCVSITTKLLQTDMCQTHSNICLLNVSPSPDQVLLVGHVGLAGRQRHVSVLVPGEAVLCDGVVPVGEEARGAAAAAGVTAVHRGVTDVGGVGREERHVEAEGDADRSRLAASASPTPATWNATRASTPGRNATAASTAANASLSRALWRSTWPSTQTVNSSGVFTAARRLYQAATCDDTSLSMQETNEGRQHYSDGGGVKGRVRSQWSHTCSEWTKQHTGPEQLPSICGAGFQIWCQHVVHVNGCGHVAQTTAGCVLVGSDRHPTRVGLMASCGVSLRSPAPARDLPIRSQSQLSIMKSQPVLYQLIRNTWTNIGEIRTNWQKRLFNVCFDCFSLIPSANMQEAGLMTCIAASHKGAMDMFYLHFCSGETELQRSQKNTGFLLTRF